MPTTILFIHRQLAFAVSVKQAMERTGSFEVHPFTSLDSATEYLATHPQDLAIVDFELPSASGDEIVVLLRETQPDIPIIATPMVADSLITALRIQGSVEARFTARDVLPIIETIVASRKPGTVALSDTDSSRYGLLTRIIEQKKTDVLPQTKEQPNEVELPGRSDAPYRPNPFEEELDEDFPPVSFEPPEAPALSPSEASGALDPSQLFADFETWSVNDPFADGEDDFPPPEDEDFDEILTALEDAPSTDERPRNRFDNLVDSMRAGEPAQPLPARQQVIEFSLSSAMDSLVEQIERKRGTDPLEAPTTITPIAGSPARESTPPDEPAAFRADPDELAALFRDDDDQSPTFEDTGTISDLITGVNEPSFMNVLSILRGEEVPEEPEAAGVDDTDDLLSSIEAGLGMSAPPDETRIEYDFDSIMLTDDADSGSTPAKVILQSATAPTTSPDDFSIDDLLDSIERQLPQHRPRIQMPPSWQTDADRAAATPTPQPDTLPEASAPLLANDDRFEPDLTVPHTTAEDEAVDFDSLLAEAAADDFANAFDQTTIANTGQQTPEALSVQETELLRGFDDADAPLAFEDAFELTDTPSTPDSLEFDALEEDGSAEAQPAWDADWEAEIDAPEADAESASVLAYDERPPGYDTEFDRMATFAVAPALPEEDESTFDAQHIDDPYIAQLALSLTDVSLELTAEATMLTREKTIVAYAGRMAREDMTELREVIADDFEARPDEARIRFVNLPASGKDYMVYSRRTVEDLTLTLIFSGETPLRDIRQQGKRLIEALRAVPDIPADIQAMEVLAYEDEGAAAGDTVGTATLAHVPVDESIARAPYAFVWILRDPNAQLSRAAAHAIVSGMNVQLRELAWRVRELRAADEYVYLLADVPGEQLPYQVVRDLKRRAALIAHAQSRSVDVDSLWADSYLVMTPGRSLEMDEIRQFIDFERML